MIRIFAKYSIISFFVTLIFLAYTAFAFWSDKSLNFDNIPKTIKISDNGLDYEINTATDNVGDVFGCLPFSGGSSRFAFTGNRRRGRQ